MKPINEWIRELREDRDLSQTYIAEVLGIQQQTYSKYETGEYSLPIRHLKALAAFYQTNTDYILQLTQFKQPLQVLEKPFLDTVDLSVFMSEALSLNKKNRDRLWSYLQYLKGTEHTDIK